MNLILIETWKAYALHFVTSPVNVLVLIAALILSLLFYFLFKKTDRIKVKVSYLYTHIFFLFFPFLFSAFTSKCWKCVIPVCDCSPNVVVYGTFGGISLAVISSFLLLPYLYTWASRSREVVSGSLKEQLKQLCCRLNLPQPKLYTLNDVAPKAYSITNIRPSVFVSVGLCEILNRKEMEAVLLHELDHLRNKTSFWRFSTHTLRIFSPLSTFITLDRSIQREELDADAFAVQEQGTAAYLQSAKHKVNEMNCLISEFQE